MKREIETKFYTFSQNNSGGSFVKDNKAGICEYVIVEAINADDANNRAEEIGLYFDGCDDGKDCQCCGDRWYRMSESDGKKIPSIYGESVEEIERSWYREKAFIHYIDGTKKEVIFHDKTKTS